MPQPKRPKSKKPPSSARRRRGKRRRVPRGARPSRPGLRSTPQGRLRSARPGTPAHLTTPGSSRPVLTCWGHRSSSPHGTRAGSTTRERSSQASPTTDAGGARAQTARTETSRRRTRRAGGRRTEGRPAEAPPPAAPRRAARGSGARGPQGPSPAPGPVQT